MCFGGFLWPLLAAGPSYAPPPHHVPCPWRACPLAMPPPSYHSPGMALSRSPPQSESGPSGMLPTWHYAPVPVTRADIARYAKATPKYLILVPGVACGGWPRSSMFPGDPGCALIALDGPGLDSICLDGPTWHIKWAILHCFELKRAINSH